MGPTCNAPYNPCAEQTCENGGQCNVKKMERDPGNDFYCECLPGFNGLKCENNVNECENVTCTDNKICVDLVTINRFVYNIGQNCKCWAVVVEGVGSA